MISALLFSTGIYSTLLNLKTYKQAKNFFNPAKPQSSPKESLKENCETFTAMCSPFAWLNMQILNPEHSEISKMERFVKIITG